MEKEKWRGGSSRVWEAPVGTFKPGVASPRQPLWLQNWFMSKASHMVFGMEFWVLTCCGGDALLDCPVQRSAVYNLGIISPLSLLSNYFELKSGHGCYLANLAWEFCIYLLKENKKCGTPLLLLHGIRILCGEIHTHTLDLGLLN